MPTDSAPQGTSKLREIVAHEGTLTDATLDEIEQRALQNYPRNGYAQRSAREVAMVTEVRHWREVAGRRLAGGDGRDGRDGLEAAARVCEGRARTLTGSAKWEALKCAAAVRGYAGQMELAATPREQEPRRPVDWVVEDFTPHCPACGAEVVLRGAEDYGEDVNCEECLASYPRRTMLRYGPF